MGQLVAMSLPSELSVDFVRHLKEKITHALSATRNERLLVNVRSLETRVNSLEQHLVGGGACTVDNHELLLNTLYYTSQEYLCGIDEGAWQGAVPAHFELRDVPYPVRRGPGGWGPALQTFQVRGLNYLEDNVKVCANLRHVVCG